MENLSGQTLKGYSLLERIGSGGYGAVYRARQPSLGREVAIKVILAEVASQPAFIRHFEIEAQLIARLEHLHIVPLYDFWRDPGGAYLVMRWLRGGSLRQALEQGPFDLQAAVLLVEQVASGLAAAHNHRVVHRDLKPSNILLDEEGNAYLSDFGIAKDLNAASQGTPGQEMLAGSLDYLSPEQARGEQITPQTDLYSLGVTIYEALTGAHPFPGLTSVERLYKHINDPLPEIDSLDSETRAAVNEVIQIATAKDPAQRYKDALEMAVAFRTAARLEENGDPRLLEETLTRREQEILQQILDGLSNKQIARELFIEVPTVKWHITQLYRKLGVRSRMQAIVRARELKLLQPDPIPSSSSGERPDPISVALPTPANPFKGLRPFDAADSRDFFGREEVIEKILARLGEMGKGARFLAVLGPSGSGKSSLVSAGLIPAIWAGKLPGSERWFVIEMAPGARPLDELEVALTRIAAVQAANLHTHLTRDSGGLLRAASLILPNDGSELFLFIDQFEELFVQADPGARNHFLDLIHAAVSDPRSRVRVVIALRADFYDRPLNHPGFGELLRSRMETLLPLSAEELERAVVQPARQVGVAFEPGLPAHIIAEMLYQPGALPLLQYALTELFEGREGRVMTRRAYQDIGGAVGALAQRADEVYLGFSPAGRQAARQMFLRLVNLGEESREKGQLPDTRRRVPRGELLALSADPDLMDEVIDTFGAYRLLSLDHDAATRQPTVELAHEALLGEWGWLEAWLAESRQDLQQHQRFQALAGEWERSGREAGYLLRAARLDQFEAWAQDTGLALTPAEQAFLAASLTARGSRQEADEARRQRELKTARQLAETEHKRAKEQARALRRLRWLTAALALFLVAAVGAALFARTESTRAEAQARIAFARELASEAIGNLEADPELGIHLALQAVQTTYEIDSFALPVAEEALHHALQALRVRLTLPHSGGLAFSPDGAYLVTGGGDGSIAVWDAQTGEQVRSFAGHDAAVTSVAFSPDGRQLATSSEDYQRIVWDFSTGEPILDLPGPPDPAYPEGLSKVAFSPDGELLLTTAQFHEAGIWEIASGREIVHFDQSAGPTGDFRPDGRSLALMTAVWDISGVLESRQDTGSGEAGEPANVLWRERLFDYADPFIEFRAASSDLESAFQEPGSVSYSPDGSRLLTAVVSSLAVMRDARSGEAVFTLAGHTGIINGSAYGPQGARIATASADGTARLWDADTGQELLVLEGHQDEVIQVVFSPDGSHLATSSLDGSTKVWDISLITRGEWLNPFQYGGRVSLAFMPGSVYLVALGEDGVLDTINLDTGKIIYSLQGPQDPFPNRPAFSPDGTTMAIFGEQGSVNLINAMDGTLLRSFATGRTVSALAFSPDGGLLAVGSEDGVLTIIDLDSSEVLGEWLVQGGFVNGLAFGLDGKWLSMAGADGDVILADLNLLLPDGAAESAEKPVELLPDQAILAILSAHTDVITHLEPSPDGSRLITASWDGTARIWDAESGDLLKTLAGHQGRVFLATFSPDGKRIATAGADGAVILWDAGSGERILTLGPQPQAISSLAFSTDGRFLAASSADGSVRVYVMPIEDLVALARQRLTRELTANECRKYLHRNDCP